MTTVAGERLGASIHDLPAIVAGVIERAGGSPPRRLAMTYLRVKPGRGLAAVYRAAAGEGAPDQPPLVYLSIDESGMAGAGTLPARMRRGGVALEGAWPGVVTLPDAGLVLQSFPVDRKLPALAAACDLAPGTPVHAALESAAADLLDDASARVLAASVAPLRYKPGDRCVVRYRLSLETGSGPAETTLIGKVYRDPADAERVHRLLDRMHAAQLPQTGRDVAGVPLVSPLVPRPVGLTPSLGLTLNEDVRRPGVDVVAGTDALGLHGDAAAIPEARLAATGVALARLHTGTAQPGEDADRTPQFEASRALGRAERLAEFAPAFADAAMATARLLERRLHETSGAPALPAHGSFKSAQVLFRGPDEVLVTDFDQFCRADPALDVGYFLAYLRPASLWYGKRGAREWFARSGAAFTDAYRRAVVDLGGAPVAVDGSIDRARLYEAALLFKIANRRPNRLNSVRPLELGAMLAEADACLTGSVR